MTQTADEDTQRRSTWLAHQHAELTVEELWLRYFALGGIAAALEIEAYLHGLMVLPPMQRDMLAQAVNERLDELVGRGRVPYSRFVDVEPQTGPLAALVTLLDRTSGAPPERLAQAASAAAHALGVQLTIYLVDYGQRTLVPVPDPASDLGHSHDDVTPLDVTPLDVNASLAGRAFREVETIPSVAVAPPRLWVPLLDGVERLGVLDVRLADAASLDDPALRAHCQALARLLGHLVTAVDGYGDALTVLRRTRPRSAAAEATWQLLPPLTAQTDRVVVTGLVEPSDTVGGDVFDYALSQDTAHLAVMDATGHSLAAGLVTAAALATYRSARRGGSSLAEQARAVADVVATHFSAQNRYATAVLAELDLVSGRLQYVNAGHPAPLLLRGGRVVKSLAEGRRPLFGLDVEQVVVGDEILEPGDLLAFYTDGVTEARDENREFFGEDRLVEFLRREAASGRPAPEVVRRLMHAVVDHQHGGLQDDATMLLVRWEGPPPRTTSWPL